MYACIVSESRELPANVEWIDDPADPRLDDYRDVRDRDLRIRQGLFIGEQFLVVEAMLRRHCPKWPVKSVLALPQHAERFAAMAAPEIAVYAGTVELMHSIVGFDIHRGVLAAGYRPRAEQLTLDAALPPPGTEPLTLLLCDGIRNIDNIGMLFRNAAAFAVDAVILSPDCHDPLYRKSLRVSIGHVLNVPWARSPNWPADLARLRSDWGVTLLGAAIGAGSQPMDEVERPSRVGIVVGGEFNGLSEVARHACDGLIRIPMAPQVDSVNVATAAAICLHCFSHGRRV